MKKSDALIIYPVNKTNIGIVRWLAQRYKIIALSPCGFSILGRDVGVIDNRNKLGIRSNETISDEEMLRNCKNIEIIEYEDEISIRSKLENLIQLADLKGASVKYHFFSREEYQKELEKQSNKWLKFRWMDRPVDFVFTGFKIPIIYVGSLFDESKSYELFLGLVLLLREKGIKVSGMGCDKTCSIFGTYRIPEKFSELNISNDEKIKNLRNYLKCIVSLEKPEILVVQVPGAMMALNNALTNGFGVDTYLFSNVTSPDLFYCCMPYELINPENIEQYKKYFENKFNFPLEGLVATNQIIDGTESFYGQKIQYFYQDITEMEQKLKKSKTCSTQVYNLYSEKELQVMVQKIIDM